MHVCKKCGIYFDTTPILMKHTNQIHNFDDSDHDNDDLEVIYDDNEKPACVKDFKKILIKISLVNVG